MFQDFGDKCESQGLWSLREKNHQVTKLRDVMNSHLFSTCMAGNCLGLRNSSRLSIVSSLKQTFERTIILKPNSSQNKTLKKKLDWVGNIENVCLFFLSDSIEEIFFLFSISMTPWQELWRGVVTRTGRHRPQEIPCQKFLLRKWVQISIGTQTAIKTEALTKRV